MTICACEKAGIAQIRSASRSQRAERNSRMRSTSRFFRACPARRVDSTWAYREFRHNMDKTTPRSTEGLVKSAQKVFSASVFSSHTFRAEYDPRSPQLRRVARMLGSQSSHYRWVLQVPRIWGPGSPRTSTGRKRTTRIAIRPLKRLLRKKYPRPSRRPARTIVPSSPPHPPASP
jgi:hypothetical protein